MNDLEDFLTLTQNDLFNLLRKKYKGKTFVHKGSYILVQGDAPIMLLAHLDTVHEKPVKHICKSDDGNILMSPQGIGGDDRCGVYALVKVYETAPIKPWLLFTCDEEIGGVGASDFVDDYQNRELPNTLNKLKLLIEIDRKGSKDAVYYDCNNPDFEAYITSKGFKTAYGSFSDISIIAPELGVAAVNLSSGYYNAYSLHEYINRKQLETVIKAVIEIIADTAKSDFPKYKYIKRVWKAVSSNDQWNDSSSYDERDYYDIWKGFSNKKSTSVTNMYNALLEYYTREELEQLRKEYGDRVIRDLYYNEFSPFFDVDKLEYGV